MLIKWKAGGKCVGSLRSSENTLTVSMVANGRRIVRCDDHLKRIRGDRAPEGASVECLPASIILQAFHLHVTIEQNDAQTLVTPSRAYSAELTTRVSVASETCVTLRKMVA